MTGHIRTVSTGLMLCLLSAGAFALEKPDNPFKAPRQKPTVQAPSLPPTPPVTVQRRVQEEQSKKTEDTGRLVATINGIRIYLNSETNEYHFIEVSDSD